MASPSLQPNRSPQLRATGWAKKGGGGGKGTWGRPGDEVRFQSELNPDDPLYDEEEEPFMLDGLTPAMSGAQFKTTVDAAMRSFAKAHDPKQAAVRLSHPHCSLFRHYIVTKAVRECLPADPASAAALVTYLTSAASGPMISQEQLERGLDSAFQWVPDWELDAPGMGPALFALADALVESDHLPSAFVDAHRRFADKRDFYRHTMRDALDEYWVSFDCAEFLLVLSDVRCPPLHAHAVKYIVRGALGQADSKKERAAVLLAALCDPRQRGCVTMLQFMHGLELVLMECEDLALDNPGANDVLANLVARAVVDECVPPTFLDHVFTVKQGDAGWDVVNAAKAIVAEPGAAARLHTLWGADEQ